MCACVSAAAVVHASRLTVYLFLWCVCVCVCVRARRRPQSFILDLDANELELTFEEPVRASTLDAAVFRLLDADGVHEIGNATSRLRSSTVTYSPNALAITLSLSDVDVDEIKVVPSSCFCVALLARPALCAPRFRLGSRRNQPCAVAPQHQNRSPNSSRERTRRRSSKCRRARAASTTWRATRSI